MCRSVGLACLVFVSMVASARIAVAQTLLNAGATVRVTRSADTAPLVGELTSFTGDVWTIAQRSGEAVRILVADIDRAEVRVQRRHALRGALIGGGVGLIGGVLLAVSVRDDCSRERDVLGLCDALTSSATGPLLILTPLVGAGAGALIGTVVTSSHWVPVVVPGRAAASAEVGWSVPFVF